MIVLAKHHKKPSTPSKRRRHVPEPSTRVLRSQTHITRSTTQAAGASRSSTPAVGGSTSSTQGAVTSATQVTRKRRSGPPFIFVKHVSGLAIADKPAVKQEDEKRRMKRLRAAASRKQKIIPTSHAWYKRVIELRRNWGSPSWVYLSHSRIQGIGLFTKRQVKKNTIIMEYLGEIIGPKEQKRREQAGQGGHFAKYVNRTVIDGKNRAKFINHSCEPNCILELMTFANGEASVVITAKDDIPSRTELTTDYYWTDDSEDGDLVPCKCGTPSCRILISKPM